MLKTPLGRFRVISWLEGLSFLVLLGIAMPLKRFANMPEAVTIVGWAHGVFFIGYVVAVARITKILNWSSERVMGALAAGVLPFGPFVFDAFLRRNEKAVSEKQ